MGNVGASIGLVEQPLLFFLLQSFQMPRFLLGFCLFHHRGDFSGRKFPKLFLVGVSLFVHRGSVLRRELALSVERLPEHC